MTVESNNVRGGFRMLADRLVRESFPDYSPDEINDYIARAEARIRRNAARLKPQEMFGVIIVVAVNEPRMRFFEGESEPDFVSSRVDYALRSSEIYDVERVGSGDGVIIAVPSDAPFDKFITYLAASLVRFEGRVRVALHEGRLYRGEDGWKGHDLVHAVRLAGAEPLRQALAAAPWEPLALIVSATLHDSLVGRLTFPSAPDSRGNLQLSSFRPVDVTLGELHSLAWIWSPNDTGPMRPYPPPKYRQARSRLTFSGDQVHGDQVIRGGKGGTEDGEGPGGRR